MSVASLKRISAEPSGWAAISKVSPPRSGEAGKVVADTLPERDNQADRTSRAALFVEYIRPIPNTRALSVPRTDESGRLYEADRNFRRDSARNLLIGLNSERAAALPSPHPASAV